MKISSHSFDYYVDFYVGYVEVGVCYGYVAHEYSNFKDYFFTNKEIRNIKLSKINYNE